MIASINVDFVYAEPEYDSFGGAVAASTASERTAQARRDNTLLVEDSVVAWSIQPSVVEAVFSGGHVLRISCDGDRVCWSLGEVRELVRCPEVYADSVELNFASGEPSAWRPRSLLDARVGIAGVALSPAATLLTLCVRGHAELMFCQMVDSKGRRRLYWDEE